MGFLDNSIRRSCVVKMDFTDLIFELEGNDEDVALYDHILNSKN